MSRTKRKAKQRTRDPRPGYAKLLRLKHIRPGRVACFVFFEGSIALAVLLLFAELVSVWTALAIPVLVAVMVKMNDVIAGAVAGPADDVATEVDPLVRQWETDLAEDEHDEHDEDEHDEDEHDEEHTDEEPTEEASPDEHDDEVDSDGLSEPETDDAGGADEVDKGAPEEVAYESEDEPDDDVDTDAGPEDAEAASDDAVPHSGAVSEEGPVAAAAVEQERDPADAAEPAPDPADAAEPGGEADFREHAHKRR